MPLFTVGLRECKSHDFVDIVAFEMTHYNFPRALIRPCAIHEASTRSTEILTRLLSPHCHTSFFSCYFRPPGWLQVATMTPPFLNSPRHKASRAPPLLLDDTDPLMLLMNLRKSSLLSAYLPQGQTDVL